MSGSFGATPEQLAAAARHVEQAHQQVTDHLNAMRTQLEPLGAAWHGQAYTAFVALMGRWNDDAAKLTGALRSIGALIEISGREYDQAEQEQSQRLSSITAALG
jgi:WXG100 family type VII secretion target